MKVFVETDDNGYISQWATGSSGNDVEVDASDEIMPHLRGTFQAVKLVDGELQYDEAREQEIIAELENRVKPPSTDEKVAELKSVSSALLGGEQSENEELVALTLNKALQKFAATLPEEEALELAAMYPKWETGRKYAPGQYVRHGLNQDGEPQVFSVLQEHTSQADWLPKNAAALYKKLGFTDDGTPTWVQPLGATDAYQTGDKVSHNGKIYVSTAANNVWEPGVYGWKLDGGITQAVAKARR